LQTRAQQLHLTHIETSCGDMENIPLANNLADVVLLSQSLHHAATPEVAVKECIRILKPGGRFVLLDLWTHEQEWVREKLGDTWLGFNNYQVKRWAKENDCKILHIKKIDNPNQLPLILSVMQKENP
jgi:ubiquinone/menaquinone biosynthesis C-methylase UbiE